MIICWFKISGFLSLLYLTGCEYMDVCVRARKGAHAHSELLSSEDSTSLTPISSTGCFSPIALRELSLDVRKAFSCSLLFLLPNSHLSLMLMPPDYINRYSFVAVIYWPWCQFPSYLDDFCPWLTVMLSNVIVVLILYCSTSYIICGLNTELKYESLFKEY